MLKPNQTSGPDSGAQELPLSHEQYAELTEKMCDLSVILGDGSIDHSQFIDWAIHRFNLDPFTHYRIVVKP